MVLLIVVSLTVGPLLTRPVNFIPPQGEHWMM